MVFRSTWQGLQQWANTYLLGAGTNGLTDEDLKAQAIQDEAQALNLIKIENARGMMKIKLAAVIGCLALFALIVVVAATLVIVEAAGDLKLPWSRISTTVASVLGTSGIAGLALLITKRILARRRTAGATPGNPPQNRTEGDQNQMAP